MRKSTITLLTKEIRFDNLGNHLELFVWDRLDTTHKFFDKGNGRYEIWQNDDLMLEIQTIQKEKDELNRNRIELYMACPTIEGEDVFEIFYTWLKDRCEFEIGIDYA